MLTYQKLFNNPAKLIRFTGLNPVQFKILTKNLNLDSSNICRMIKKLAPILDKAADPDLRSFLNKIKRKRKKMGVEEFIKTYPDLIELVIDSTEQKRQRPINKKRQKNLYSGKKHQHSFKTQIVVNKKGKIINISRIYPARVHDKTILIKEKTLDKIPEEIKVFLDKGYIKTQKIYPQKKIFIPIKRNRWKRKLTRSEKIKNTKQAKKRVLELD